MEMHCFGQRLINQAFFYCRQCLAGALGLCLWVSAGADEFQPVYEISIAGPMITLQEQCADPCEILRVEDVGEVKTKTSQIETESSDSEANFSGDCYGECKQKKSEFKVQIARSLKEGMELTIEDRWAHFIFYSVVDTEQGPKTRRRHHEFRVDRPMIAVTLDEHDVQIDSNVPTDEGVIRKRTITR